MLAHARPHLAHFVAAFLIMALVLAGPIVQPEHYHAFADQRAWLGIPNAADVLSNLAFLLAAAIAAERLWRAPLNAPLRLEYAVFAGALALTAAGSAWYHLAPDNARLVWDRVPIALACAALLAAAIKQAHPRLGAALPCLLAFGLGSVYLWTVTGDLRPYLLIQLAPLVLIPILQWQADAPIGERKAFGLAILLYVLAKLCEVGDTAGLELLGVLSGHTLKHLLAAAAALVIVRGVWPARVRLPACEAADR
jgi:hypothetical protein